MTAGGPWPPAGGPGPWLELTACTGRAITGLWTFRNGAALRRVDLGVGAAGEESVLVSALITDEFQWCPVDIPEGVRLVLREHPATDCQDVTS